MEPFPPELIAQIATKLFQQGPHDASAASHVASARDAMPAQAGQVGVHNTGLHPAVRLLMASCLRFPLHSVDAACRPKPCMGSHAQSMPTSPTAAFGSSASGFVPTAHAPMSHAPVGYTSPASMPAPSATGFPVAGCLARQCLLVCLQWIRFTQRRVERRSHFAVYKASRNSGASSSGRQAEDGLSRFVAQVRNQSPAKRENCLDRDQMRFRQPSHHAGAGNLTQFSAPLDIDRIRNDFPILHQKVHGHPLAWLDNAATTQKPQVVIDAISHFYATDNSNIHRAAHSLAARATDAYEASRETVARFLGASSSKDIVFARGTTETINLVANTYGARYLKKGDEILLSMVEHHANIVPWQMIAKRKGAVIRVIPINDRGEILMDEYLRLLSPRTRIVSLTHASNSLGTILPVAEMSHMAKRYGARVLIDGAQSVSHMPINVQAIGCDFSSSLDTRSLDRRAWELFT